MIILTGAPGSGKTSLINTLKERGYQTVSEAATQLIIEKQQSGIKKPWEQSGFIDELISIQLKAVDSYESESLVFFDRSIICTYALAQYLGRDIPKKLLIAINKLPKDATVFHIESLDIIEQTSARTLSLSEAKAFGKLHLEVYKHFGYQPIQIPKDTIEARINLLLKVL